MTILFFNTIIVLDLCFNCNLLYYYSYYKQKTMAKPITETPVLKGKDAANFVSNQQNYDRVPISDAERERMRQNYQKIQSLVVTNVSR